MRTRVRIVEEGRCIFVSGRRVGTLLHDGGFRGIYVGTRQAFALDVDRLADLAAWLQYRSVPFRIERGGDDG